MNVSVVVCFVGTVQLCCCVDFREGCGYLYNNAFVKFGFKEYLF